jgi:hypothetical protein
MSQAVEDMVAAAMASIRGIAGETGQGLGNPAELAAAMASLGGTAGASSGAGRGQGHPASEREGPPVPEGQKKRGKNFCPDEDAALARAWWDTSKDSIKGTDQNGKDFWLKVWKVFLVSRGLNPKDTSMQVLGSPRYRSAGSLENRFSVVQAEVNKFTGFYTQAVKFVESASGESADSILPKALELYKAKEKKEFKNLEAWRILKESPRFQPPAAAAVPRETGEDDSSPDKRPQGNKAAKADVELLRLQKEHVLNIASLAQSNKRKSEELRDYVCLQIFKATADDAEDEESRAGLLLLKKKKRAELEAATKQ